MNVAARARLSILAMAIAAMGSQAAYGQSISVSVDRTVVSQGESITATIVMQGRFDSYTGPELEKLRVVGRSSSTSISIVGGRVSQRQTLTLTLLATQPGQARIGPVQILAGGKMVASSKALTIKVLAGGGGGGTGHQVPSPVPGNPSPTLPSRPPMSPGPVTRGHVPTRLLGRKAFLLIHSPERKVYVGEPVVIEYVLYVDPGLPLQSIQVEHPPDLKGAVVDEMQVEQDRSKRVRVQGYVYDAYAQWRAAVTATKPGVLHLPPMSLVLTVGDFFTSRRYRLTGQASSLTFEPVPAKGRPADYKEGTVGAYVMKARLDKTAVKVGERAILTVEITGTGNLRGIQSPEVKAVDGLQVSGIPSTDLDKIVVDRGGLSGKRVFQYLLAPERPGRYDLGRLTLPYFNPLTGKFERTSTDRIVMIATEGTSGPPGPIQRATRAPKQTIVQVLRPETLASQPAVTLSVDRQRVFPWYAAALGPAVFAASLLFAWGRRLRQASAAESRRRRAVKKALKELRRLRSRTDVSGLTLFQEVERILKEFVENRYGVDCHTMTPADIASALVSRGAQPRAVELLKAELEACEFAKFAPKHVTQADAADVFGRMTTLLKAFEE